MRDKKASFRELQQAMLEIAVADDSSLGPVQIYRPRSLRERMADEQSRIEEQNRQRIDRLRRLRSDLVKN